MNGVTLIISVSISIIFLIFIFIIFFIKNCNNFNKIMYMYSTDEINKKTLCICAILLQNIIYIFIINNLKI